MKILTIPGWYPSDFFPYNGDFIKNQADLLRKYGLKIDVVYADLSVANFFHGYFRTKMDITIDHKENRSMIARGPFIPKKISFFEKVWIDKFAALISEYIELYGHPAILHAQTYLGGIVSVQIKKRYNIPMVITEHYSGLLDGSIKPSHLAYAKRAYCASDIVISVSQALADSIYALSGVESRVIPNFIDIEKFKPNGKNNKTVRILYTGDFIPRKNPEKLIIAFNKARSIIKNLELSMVGSGPLLNKCEALAKKLGAEKVIRFCGQRNQEEVAQIMRNCDMLVLPSQVETFGLVLIEALSCGVPVISYDNGGSRDILQDNLGIMVRGHSAQKLAEAIIDMSQNLDHYNSSEMREHVIKKFSTSAVAPQLEQLYTHLKCN